MCHSRRSRNSRQYYEIRAWTGLCRISISDRRGIPIYSNKMVGRVLPTEELSLIWLFFLGPMTLTLPLARVPHRATMSSLDKMEADQGGLVAWISLIHHGSWTSWRNMLSPEAENTSSHPQSMPSPMSFLFKGEVQKRYSINCLKCVVEFLWILFEWKVDYLTTTHSRCLGIKSKYEMKSHRGQLSSRPFPRSFQSLIPLIPRFWPDQPIKRGNVLCNLQ